MILEDKLYLGRADQAADPTTIEALGTDTHRHITKTISSIAKNGNNNQIITTTKTNSNVF